MPEPFFATILTLTNHAPFTVPADAPSELFGDDIHARIVSYVDWAFGQFYDEFFQQHPHSVMLILSDQGISYGERVDTQSNDYRDVRKQFRMPFVIAAPDLPKSLRGKTFDHLVSNVDVAPTLANLLSFDEPNQFMGVDMFSRSTPIYTNYFDRFLKIVESDQKPMLQPVKPSLIEILTQLGHNNQYMPAESS